MAGEPKVAHDPGQQDRIERVKMALRELSKQCLELDRLLSSRGGPLHPKDKMLVRMAQLPMMQEVFEEAQMSFLVGQSMAQITEHVAHTLETNFFEMV